MATSSRPTPTSYALLGLVAAQADTGYGLAARMQLTYRYFWPRARSHVFTELTRLEARGWVAGERVLQGKRAGRRYRVTAAGRRALTAWLETPVTGFALELEGLVRVYLAAFGSKKALRKALDSMEAEGDEMLRIAGELIPAYLAGNPPPPADTFHLRVPLIDFLASFGELVRAWAVRSRDELSRVQRASTRDARGRARLRRLPQLRRVQKTN